MFQTGKVHQLCILLIFLCLTGIAYGGTDAVYKLTLKKGSIIWIEGNSTLHPYESKSTVINLDTRAEFKNDPAATNESPQELLINKDIAPQISKFILQVPVKTFESGIFGFDGNFNNTLKADKSPNISFIISNYTVEADSKNPNQFVIKTHGLLNIAGTEKLVSLDTLAVTSNRIINVSGKKDLLMTEFGMTPPNLFNGLIVTDDKVTVKWQLYITIEPVIAK